MKNLLHKFKFLFLSLILVASGSLVLAQDTTPSTVKGVIRVKLEPELVKAPEGLQVSLHKGVVQSGIEQIDKLNQDYSAYEMVRVFRYSPKFEEKHKKYGLHLWYDVFFHEEAAESAVAQSYAGIPGIEIAEPVYRIELKDGTGTSRVASSTSRPSVSPFDDPYLPDQWHYNNTGQTGGTTGADINLFKAWNTTSGSSDIIISVHDMGIDVNHEDLRDNLWVNEAELNGEEGIDDDGNGYRDDVYGFNFSANYGAVDADVHGTHVAGTIAATNNNGIGVAGVAGGSGNMDGVKIMSCQILGDYGGTSLTPESFVYAADMGAVISQNSWGYSSSGYYSQAVIDAIDYFIAEAASDRMKGGVVIFAAGNNGWDLESYPGAYDPVINVAALDHKLEKAGYSNYGPSIDISAPGGSGAEGNLSMVLSTFPNNLYGYLDGTSMACPHVSGIAGLALAANGGNTYTSDDLTNQLLTSTIFIDTVGNNSEYAGGLGAGVIDAALAVASDGGIAPDAISDLTLEGIAQDFASFSWSVPADGDDDKPVAFQLFWSVEEISAENLNIARKIDIPNGSMAGSRLSHEIDGLKSLTTYHFSIRSIDRWGNVSEFSNMISGTTNEGPDASVNKESLGLTINVNTSESGSESFHILNDGVGLLKWDAVPRHVRNTDAWSNELEYPELKKLYVQRSIDLVSREVDQNERIVPNAQEYINEKMTYYDSWDGLYVVGETDLSLSNSSATRFAVSNEEGFNLTQVRAFLNQDPALGPFIVEIHQGESLDKAKLIYAEEANGWSHTATTHTINLDEQIFFEQGDFFWVVIHVPAGNLYPLGLGMELEKDQSNNCYMSLNMGKSWELLEDVWYDNRATWAVEAVSNYRALDTYMFLTPAEGQVARADSVEVLASIDASELINGSYKANIVVGTNDTDNEMIRIPVDLTVEGHRPDLVVPDMVDFGSIIYGHEKDLDISLVNVGLDAFRNPSVSISGTEFSQEGYLGSIKARSEGTMTIRFNPTQAGTSNAKVTLTSSDGNQVSFVLVGVASEPPVAVVSPADTTVGNLIIGDVVQGQFRISNEGNYPMKYYIPSYSEETFILEDPLIHKYGYSAQVDPALYSWEDISSFGTEISGHFDGTKDFKQVPIDFEFPFFGIEEDSIYITHRGVVSFDPNSVFNVSPLFFKEKYSPDRFISAWGHPFNLSEGGQIFYKSFGDRFVVQWESVPHIYFDPVTWEEKYAMVSFQIILYDNGNILIQYRDKGMLSGMDLEMVYIGIEDQHQDDGLVVNDYKNLHVTLSNGLAVHITNPGLGIFSSVSNTEGTVLSGESVLVDYTVETEKLTQNTFSEMLSIVTNDPFNNPAYHTVHLDIVGGGVSDVNLNTDTLEFGSVFQNGTMSLPFLISNDSTLDVNITGITFENNQFSLSWGEVPAILKAKHKLTYEVAVESSDLGELNDVMTVETSEGETLSIRLLAEIVEAPQIASDLTEINETLAAGDSTLVALTVSNSGGNDLVFSPEGNEWLYLLDDGTGAAFSYTVANSKTGDGTTYNWIDILESGKRDTLETFTSNPEEFFAVVPLPYSYNFYGVEYDTMYIGGNGFITFTYEMRDDIFFGPRHPIPHPDAPSNMIAPMFFFGGMGWLETHPQTGIYHQIFDDKIVVTWKDFMNNFGMGEPITFQAIMFRDGRIKFQYNTGANDQSTQWGVAGIENADGSLGINLCFNNAHYIEDKMAVMFSPANSYTVQPAESKVFQVKVDATEIFGGIYNDSLVLHNNVPGSEVYAVQASLTVEGMAEASHPDEIDLGVITIEEDPLMWPPYKAYEYEFELENTGKAGFEISSMSVDNQSGDTKVMEWYLGSGWFGPAWGWYDVTDMWSVTYPQSVMPGTVLKLKAVVTPTGQSLNIADTLLIQCTGEPGTIKIPIKAQAVFPPALNKHVEELTLHAPDQSYTKDTIVIFDNILGQSALDYTLHLKFGRIGMQANAAMHSMATAGVETDSLKSVPYKDIQTRTGMVVMSEPGYNRTLEYDTVSAPDNSLGFGGGVQFAAATGFIAPEDGFNLTHVMTWYTPDDWLDSRIIVEIRGGAEDINNSVVLASQAYEYSIPEADDKGAYLTVELDESIVFFPNEYFYVVFYYPIAVEYPQGSHVMEEVVHGRYFYGSGSYWNDVTRSSIDDAGWLMKALEYEPRGGAWVEINSSMEGSVPVGETDTVHLHFNAMFAAEGTNTADLVIASNDSKEPESPVRLNLLRNRGPQFEDAPELILSVKEGESLTYAIIASDPESDEFSYEVIGELPYLSTSQDSDAFMISLAPDYEADAVYSFEVKTTDIHGNSSSLQVTVFVENVNRSPMLIAEPETFTLYLDKGTDILDVSGMFTDPDGDALTTTSTIADPTVAGLFNANMSIALNPLTVGETSVTVIATDPQGLSVEGTVHVVVDALSSSRMAEETEIRIYPNPANDHVIVDLSGIPEVSLVRMVDTRGVLLFESRPEQETMMIDLADAAPGAYYLEITTSMGTSRKLVIKK